MLYTTNKCTKTFLQLRPPHIVILVVFLHSWAWGCKSHGKIPFSRLVDGSGRSDRPTPRTPALIARSVLNSQIPSRPGSIKSLGVTVEELPQDFADAMALLQAENKFLQDGENMIGEGYRFLRGEDNIDGYKQQKDRMLSSTSVGDVQRDHTRAMKLLQTQDSAEREGYKRIKFQHAEDNTALGGGYNLQAEDNAAGYRQQEDDTETMPDAEPETDSAAEPDGAEHGSDAGDPGAGEQMRKRRTGSATAKVCAGVCGKCSSFLGIRWSALCWKHCASNGDAFRACLVVTTSPL